jgi:hypothetical protein
MKLIFCEKCHDLVKLKKKMDRTCECGESGGKYVDDLNAEIWGPCYKIGFANHSFTAAIIAQRLSGDSTEKMVRVYGRQGYVTKGRKFEAFIIPESAETMKRVDKKVVDSSHSL